MKELVLNEAPVRTARNFRINNIKLENVNISEISREFNNVIIKNDSSKISISNDVSDFKLKYGLSKDLENQVNLNANQKYKILIDSKSTKNIEIDFNFDNENIELIDNIEIEALSGAKANIIIKYDNSLNLNCLKTNNSKMDEKYYHNGVIRLLANKDSNINIVIVNFINTKSDNFISIENNLGENVKLKYTIIDFGGKNSITNYYSNLQGKSSNNILNTIYLGQENQLFDLNYIAELRGEKANIDIDVQGALKDEAKKNFKGTIDFKKGCKKAKGNENEFCMLLSNKAKSIALPMLLCSEEDVEGNHSTSSGKAGEKELFYIMSRGFEYKEAMKLLVKANFNKIIENIKDEDLKLKVLQEIDRKLDYKFIECINKDRRKQYGYKKRFSIIRK